MVETKIPAIFHRLPMQNAPSAQKMQQLPQISVISINLSSRARSLELSSCIPTAIDITLLTFKLSSSIPHSLKQDFQNVIEGESRRQLAKPGRLAWEREMDTFRFAWLCAGTAESTSNYMYQVKGLPKHIVQHWRRGVGMT